MLKLCRDASVGGGGFQGQQQLEERDAVSGAAFSDTLFAKCIAEQAVKIAEGEDQLFRPPLAAHRLFTPAPASRPRKFRACRSGQGPCTCVRC